MLRKVIVFTYNGSRAADRKKVQDYQGLFHQWGTEYEELRDGSVQYTVAIVEKEDGSVCTAMPSMIQFVKE